MEKEARFILKEDKYSLLIIQSLNINKKTKKGISIYKKNLEINEINEDNINMALNKKDKIYYSFANLGFYDISGIKCFVYCSEKDIKEVGIICFTKIYQIMNLSYIILEDIGIDTASILSFFKEHSKTEVNKGLFFAQDLYNMDKSFDVFFHGLYERNKNICHISPNINFCYNYDNISYINKFKLMDITTHVIYGYFSQNKVIIPKKEELITNLIIKNKELNNESFTKDSNIKEIELILCPNNNVFLNQIFHFIFYVFDGYYLDAKLVLYDLLKKDQTNKRTDNGTIIIVDIDNMIDKRPDKKEDIINKEIEQELNQILGCINNKVIVIHKKKEIAKTIKNNKNIFSEIKYNYEYKGDEFILEFQEKQLLIISDNNENLMTIIENIIETFHYKFLDKKVEIKIKIKSSIKTMLESHRNFKQNPKILNSKKLRVEAIDEKYLSDKSINKYLNEIRLNEEKEENDKSNNIINKEENNTENNIENKEENKNEIIIENTISEIKNINLMTEEKINKKYLYIVTFNAANYNFESLKEEKDAINKFFFPKEVKKLFKNKFCPTFIAFGFQEIVKLNTSNVIFDSNKSSAYLWESKLTDKLLKDYNYTLQYRENLVGILILIFVKTSEANNIKNMKKSIIKAGFMKALGNKGYILYEFKYNDKSFAIATGHLTAGENEKNYKERTNLIIDILNHKNDKNSNKFYENDFYFLFGDMNFRVKIDRKEFFDFYEKIKDVNMKTKINDDSVLTNKKLLYNLYLKFNLGINLNNIRKYSIGKKDLYKLKSFQNFKEKNSINDNNTNAKRNMSEPKYKYFFFKEHLISDELNGFKGSLTSYNVTEGPIKFLPTYKYKKGAKYYDLNKRTPAWTDRILYKKSENIKCIKYNRINIKLSDHRPVYGIFEINC